MRPQQAHAPRRHRGYVAAGTAVTLGGALGYVGLVDPHSSRSIYPLCPFKWLTGWDCPFCGGLRMTHDVLHGQLTAAAYDNAFLMVVIPLLAAWLVLWGRRGRPALPIPALVAAVFVTTAWTVLRNLPGFPLVPTVLGG